PRVSLFALGGSARGPSAGLHAAAQQRRGRNLGGGRLRGQSMGFLRSSELLGEAGASRTLRDGLSWMRTDMGNSSLDEPRKWRGYLAMLAERAAGYSMGCLAAMQFLTIAPPLVRRSFTAAELGRAVGYFPLVGLLIGGFLVGLDRLLALFLPPSVA